MAPVRNPENGLRGTDGYGGVLSLFAGFPAELAGA